MIKSQLLRRILLSHTCRQIATVSADCLSVFAILLLISAAPTPVLASNAKSIQLYAQQVYARPAQPIEGIPPVAKLENFKYAAYSLRSPFDPAQPRTSASALLPDQHRKKEALEEFPLDALRFVGVITESHTPWALIMGPDSTIHRVRVGNYIGQDYGRIIAISESGITLQEVIADNMGGWRNKQRLLSLLEQTTV